MATNYRLEQNQSKETMDRFNAVLATLASERYPNGVGGHKDRMAHLFEAAGFEISRYIPGNAHCAADYWFRSI